MRALATLIACCICTVNFALASEPTPQKKKTLNGAAMNKNTSFGRMKPTRKNKRNRRITANQGNRFNPPAPQQTAGKIPYHFPDPGEMVSIENIPSGQLTDTQITNLFSHKIVKGTHLRRGFSFIRHFRLDGFLIEKSPQRGEHTGYWRANQGCLCIGWENKKEKCGKIMKKNGRINQYRLKKAGSKVRVVAYEEFVTINDDSE